MFENLNPFDRTTAYIEIAIMLLLSFVFGYLVARIPIEGSKKKLTRTKKKQNIEEDKEEVDPRDIITEPTQIRAVLTRERGGKAIDSSNDATDKPLES